MSLRLPFQSPLQYKRSLLVSYLDEELLVIATASAGPMCSCGATTRSGQPPPSRMQRRPRTPTCLAPHRVRDVSSHAPSSSAIATTVGLHMCCPSRSMTLRSACRRSSACGAPASPLHPSVPWPVPVLGMQGCLSNARAALGREVFACVWACVAPCEIEVSPVFKALDCLVFALWAEETVRCTVCSGRAAAVQRIAARCVPDSLPFAIGGGVS